MVNYARLAVFAGAFSGPLAGNAVLAVVLEVFAIILCLAMERWKAPPPPTAR